MAFVPSAVPSHAAKGARPIRPAYPSRASETSNHAMICDTQHCQLHALRSCDKVEEFLLGRTGSPTELKMQGRN